MGSLADNIKKMRAAKGWSQATLAARCGKSIKMIESGDRPWPRPETLDAIAEALGVSRDDLLAEPEAKVRRRAASGGR